MTTQATPASTSADPQATEVFGERMMNALNEAAVCLSVSIGHRTGLFDTMSGMEPATSAEIARRAGLNERYVREWLNGLTTARVVEHDPNTTHYWLPKEHAAWLTRASVPNNMAVFAQYIPLLGAVEDDIVECFRKGGGVPYARFGRFHEVMAEDSGQSVLSALDEHILPLVPGLTDRLEEGIRVLDVGCGRGQALCALGRRFPKSTFFGYDLSDDALAFARATADRSNLKNVAFEVRDASTFEKDAEPRAFDFVTTFDAVHDQARPLSLLRGIRRTLRPGGVYLMQDIKASGHVHGDMNHPIGPLLYTVSLMHCMTVSLAQGGEGLGTMWGRSTALAYLRDAGFTDVQVHELSHDIQNDYYLCRA